MSNKMKIVFAAVQENKETGEEFISLWLRGKTQDGRYLAEAATTVDGESELFGPLSRLAAAYEAEKKPHGFALEAPHGWHCDWEQVRGVHTDKKTGEERLNRWKVHAVEGEGASLRLTKADPIQVDIDPEAEAALAAL